MRRIPLVVLSLAFLALVPALAQAQAAEKTHPLTIHDMLAMDRISDSQVSPDGKWIVFNVRETDLAANRGRTDLWLVGIDGKGLRRLTSHPAADYNGRWTPCSRWVFFLSTRSGSSQVWRIRVDGGEAEQVTRLPLDVGSLVVAKGLLALTMDVFPGLTPAETAARLEAREKGQATGRLYDKLFVRHWDAWSDGRRSHLFVKPMHGDGEARDLMAAMDADTPSKPFGGPEEIAFTPDGQGLVFAAKDAGREEAWSTDSNLYYVPADGSAAPRLLTGANLAMDTMPAFSPDGKTLAYLAMARPGYEADRYRIMLLPWPEGQARTLTEAWDYSVSSLGWSADGTKLLATAPNKGQTSLFAIDAASGQAETLVGQGTVAGFAAAGPGVVFERNTLTSPTEIYYIAPGAGEKALTSLNAAKLAAVRLGQPEQFSFKGWNNETVYGYIVKPVDFDPAGKYPVAFLIHGGPQGSFGNDFHYRWNPQAYAGAGYATVSVDFHGSTGYGQAFCDAIRGDWGGKPLEDLKKGLAAALAKYPWMDGTRVGALGASYGGYMINWIAGNWSDRFKCLVAHDGNIDERAAYFETEELWFPEWDHLGTPWANPQNYEKHNPANFIKNWKTPMMIVHGGQDFRVVETQGIGSFNVLQRRGIPSQFLYFPDENHWVLKPANSILWHDTVIAWLDKWLK
ncbi:MAG TPA: S9 family peptidase [Candidatus Aminicenantes bacterium]|nr:S9 family peptidase [Candidatus Aminicenantes bacterium]HRY64826.1 S9 family peptidase [Candidatus Aminicenantes bacterium]HRZ71739.1 S9 family peptidase [Candidatus Aminicenantes bacterium]